VTEFGQSSNLQYAYSHNGVDTTTILDAALTLTGHVAAPAAVRKVGR